MGGALFALLRDDVDEFDLKVLGRVIACNLEHGDARILTLIRSDSRRNKHVVEVKLVLGVIHLEHMIAGVVSQIGPVFVSHYLDNDRLVLVT